MRDFKYVTAAELKPGQVIDEMKQDGKMWCAKFTIVEANNAFVSFYTFDNKDHIETVYSEGTLFKVYLTEEEHRAKWSDKAKDLVEKLKGPIVGDFGSHDMWNAWMDCDPWDFAKNLDENKMELIGWFWLDSVKHGWFENYDIGVAARCEDDDIVWCHYKKEWLDDLIEIYNYHNSRLQKEGE